MNGINDQQTDSDEERLDNRLLSDEDFVKLMDAEFTTRENAQSKLSDDLAKRKVWKRIHQHIQFKKWRQRKTLFSVAAAALVVIAILPVMVFVEQKPNERTKGVSPVVAAPMLQVFSMDEQGRLHASRGVHNIGSTIVFKVQSENARFVALLMSKNDDPPSLRFTGLVPPTATYHLLQNERNAYGYMFDPDDKKLRFCVLAAANEMALKQALATAKQDWLSLPGSSCAQLETIKSE